MNGLLGEVPSLRRRFEDLYQQHYAAVLAYCLRRTGRADAYDAAAETFTVVWRRIADVPAGDGALPWTYAVAARVLAHQRRSHGRRRLLRQRLAGLAPNPSPAPEMQLVRSSRDQEVVDALQRLSERDREVLRLVAWEGLERSEASAVLGCSRAALDQRIHRALRRLARQLEGGSGAPGGAIGTVKRGGGR